MRIGMSLTALSLAATVTLSGGTAFASDQGATSAQAFAAQGSLAFTPQLTSTSEAAPLGFALPSRGVTITASPDGSHVVRATSGQNLGTITSISAIGKTGRSYTATAQVDGSLLTAKVTEKVDVADLPLAVKPLFAREGNTLDQAANALYVQSMQRGATKTSGTRTWWGVPGNYRATYENTLHDYCSSTPGGAQDIVGVDMKGPCARHDLCLESRHKNGQSRLGCDNDLRGAMQDNCIEKFDWYNPKRAGCQSTAGVWAVAVIANTVKDWVFGGRAETTTATAGKNDEY